MYMRTKTEKYHFTLDKETSELFKRIVAATDMSQILVIQRAIEAFAEKKGVK